MPEKVYIFDTTLRDGEQTPGASLNVDEKLQIARQLELLNVDVIEAGFPISSRGDFAAVKAVAREIRGAQVAALARAQLPDIDAAWEAVKEATEPRIHTFISTSDIHLKHQLKKSREEVLEQAVAAVKNGKVILILSDYSVTLGKLPIHALLATGAVHHRLIQEGLRCDANIVVETATARDSHHFAVLIGYGATAVFPYLAYTCILDMQRSGEITEKDCSTLMHNYRKGINKGLFKVTSKMGISTIASYRGAQLFESVGLNQAVVDLCFKGTTNRLQGSHFEDLEADQRQLAKLAWNNRKTIEQGGLLKFVHGGEDHAYNPDVVHAMQEAVNSGDMEKWRVYSRLVNERDPIA